jgi:hypothetical protein
MNTIKSITKLLKDNYLPVGNGSASASVSSGPSGDYKQSIFMFDGNFSTKTKILDVLIDNNIEFEIGKWSDYGGNGDSEVIVIKRR